MLPVRIVATSRVQLGEIHTTEALAQKAMPHRDPAELREKTGVATRHWVGADLNCAKLGAQALREALAAAEMPASALRRVILTNSHGGDFLIPATANALLDEAGILDTADCFDINNACMGWLSAFDVASRCVATGLFPMAVVAAENLSKHLGVDQPRSYMVCADVAAAVIVTAGDPDEGVLSSSFGNNGKHRGTVYLGHPGLTGQTEHIVFSKSSGAILKLALDGLGRSARAVLEHSGLAWSDIDWVVPHQPNGNMLPRIIEHLRLPPHKVVPVVEHLGNVGSAAIPVGLHHLFKERPVKRGDRILLVGVGAGLSYGAVLYQVGELPRPA